MGNMKIPLPLFLALAMPHATMAATEKVVTLGDSLTFAYEAEFGFQKTLPGVGTVGDGFPSTVKNWIEILSNPAYRGSRFELGARKDIEVSLPFNASFSLYLRQEGNWAIPGLKVDGMRRFVQAQAGFLSLLASDEDFEDFANLLQFSDFNDNLDFSLTDFETQIRTTATRVVIGIGGNDVREIYGTVYDGGSAGSFVDDFVADMTAIIQRVQTLNPAIQVVLVNVPHIGITPQIRESHPYDPVKTGRVSAVLADLNGKLAALATARNIGYADVYTPTLPLLDPANSLCLDGIRFPNTGTTTGTPDEIWLNGEFSANFHPNTNAQTVIANEVLHAFNRQYHTQIAPLSATETLVNLLGKAPAAVDMPFASWMTGFGIASLNANDDSDGDGIPAAVEFATGLNPTLRDSEQITTAISNGMLELAYRTRLPSSGRYTITPVTSANPAGPYSPLPVPVPDASGVSRATLPLGAGPGFLRLQVIAP